MYYIVYGLLYLFSLLPISFLYFLSDLFYGFTYYILRYRRDVVAGNLKIAFPEKTDAERRTIEKKFYHNFIDSLIETIKLLSASERFIEKRFIANWEVINQVYESGRRAHLHLGHNFNWEIANMGSAYRSPYKLLSVYMPINNKAIDRLFIKLRTKTGAIMLPATQISKAILPYRDQKYLLALIADQNPGVPSNAYWFNFFGRPTPFVKGPEKAARANDCAVVFAYLTKTKRGCYVAYPVLATTEPRTLPETELSKNYVHYLEGVIRANPEMWLWTHRRWKHQWKPEYGKVIS